MSVGRADDSSVEPSKLGKVRNESDEAEQVPSSGIRLPGFIKSFLNFIWPVFGSPFTGEASFSNWREKKERVQSLANKVADSTEFEDVAVKALIQKRFETLFESLPLDSLNQLNTIVQEQPHTAYFLFHTELHYRDSAQMIHEILSKPNFAKATMEMPDKLLNIGLKRGEFFDFVRETFKTKNEDYIREFNDFVSNPLDYNPPEGLLETVVGRKIVCKDFSEETKAFISSQHPENQPLLLEWMIQEPNIAAEAFKIVKKIDSEHAIDFLAAVQKYGISEHELNDLNAFRENPLNTRVPPFVLKSNRIYKAFKSTILLQFDQPESIKTYLDQFDVNNQPLVMERLLEDINFTDRAFALQDHLYSRFGYERAKSFAHAVFEKCDSKWIDDFERFLENPHAEERENLLEQASKSPAIGAILKRIAIWENEDIQIHSNRGYDFIITRSGTENAIFIQHPGGKTKVYLRKENPLSQIVLLEEMLKDEEEFNPDLRCKELGLPTSIKDFFAKEVVKEIGAQPPAPFSFHWLIEEVKKSEIHTWANGELALTAEMPATEVEQFKNIVFVDPKTLEEVTEGIHSPPRDFKHQIAIPAAAGGFRYSDSMTVEQVEGGYVFKLKVGQKTFVYEVQGELATEEEMKKAILMTRVEWIKEGL